MKLGIALLVLAPWIATPSLALAQSDADVEVPPPPGVAEGQPIDLEAFLRGEGRGLTAEDVARRAVETSHSLDSSRAQLEQAQAGAGRALQAFFPRVEVGGRYTRLSEVALPSLFAVDPALLDAAEARAAMVTDPAARDLLLAQIGAQRAQASFTFPQILDQVSINASLTVPVTDIFLQVWPAYEAADGFAQAQEHQVRARASEVAQQAREAFYLYARARGALAVARAAADAAGLQTELIGAMVDAGTTAHVDLARVQAQYAAARVASLRAEAGTRTAEIAVRTLMHEADTQPIAIAEDLLSPLPEVPEARETLIDIAHERREETLALRRLIRARTRQVDAAEGSRWPHFVLAGNFTYANPNQRIFPLRQEFRETWDLSAVISWSPNDFFTGERLADDARAQRGQVEADLQTLEDAITIQVTQAYENLAAARAAIEAATEGVAAADETLRVRTEQYRAGATVVTELVLAVNERARAQLDLVGAALDARVAYAQLMRATGRDERYAEE